MLIAHAANKCASNVYIFMRQQFSRSVENSLAKRRKFNLSFWFVTAFLFHFHFCCFVLLFAEWMCPLFVDDVRPRPYQVSECSNRSSGTWNVNFSPKLRIWATACVRRVWFRPIKCHNQLVLCSGKGGKNESVYENWNNSPGSPTVGCLCILNQVRLFISVLLRCALCTVVAQYILQTQTGKISRTANCLSSWSRRRSSRQPSTFMAQNKYPRIEMKYALQ